MKMDHGKETERPATRECPYCLQAVNQKATRCPYCTSVLAVSNAEQQDENGPVLVLPESLEKLSDKLAESLVKKAPTALEQEAVGSGEASTSVAATE